MKVKAWFKKFFAGMGIGAGAAIPGVSGAAVAVIFKVYEDIIWSVNHIFKKFGRAMATLIPVFLGCVCAVIPCIILFDIALESFYFGLICVFAGFLIGSLPAVFDEVKGVPVTKKSVIATAIGALFVIALGIVSACVGDKVDIAGTFIEMPWWFYFVIAAVGIVAAVALTVPGLSGSLILLILGFYQPLVNNTVDWAKMAFHGDWSKFPQLLGMLGSFAVGCVIGVVIVSKIMKVLLAKHHDITYFTIIGFVSASIAVLFFNWNSIAYYLVWGGQTIEKVNPALPCWAEILIGIVLLSGCAIGAYFLVKLSRKTKQKEAIESEEKSGD